MTQYANEDAGGEPRPKTTDRIAWRVRGTKLHGVCILPEPMSPLAARAYVRRKHGITSMPMDFLPRGSKTPAVAFGAMAAAWWTEKRLKEPKGIAS